jgi:hypothetical protein
MSFFDGVFLVPVFGDARLNCGKLFQIDAVLTDIQNRLQTPTLALPQNTGEGTSVMSLK